MGSVPILLNASNPRWPAKYHEIRWTRGKQPRGDHTDNLIDRGLEGHRVADSQVMHVENVIAVVGDNLVTPHGAPTKPCELSANVIARHGNDFNG